MRRWSTELRLANIMTQNYEKKKESIRCLELAVRVEAWGMIFTEFVSFFLLFLLKRITKFPCLLLRPFCLFIMLFHHFFSFSCCPPPKHRSCFLMQPKNIARSVDNVSQTGNYNRETDCEWFRLTQYIMKKALNMN